MGARGWPASKASRPPPGAIADLPRDDWWRWAVAAVLGMAWLFLIEAVLSWFNEPLVDHVAGPARGALGPALEGSLGLTIVAACWALRVPIFERIGRLVAADAGLVAGWTALALGMRVVVGMVMLAILPSVFGGYVSNNPLTDQSTSGHVVVVLIEGVILAPVCEELLFRGVLLGTLMQRMPFVWAATISSAAFGLGHAYQEPTLGAGVLIAAVLGSSGYVLAVVVRRTGRLAPAMATHAAMNLVAVLLALTASG